MSDPVAQAARRGAIGLPLPGWLGSLLLFVFLLALPAPGHAQWVPYPKEGGSHHPGLRFDLPALTLEPWEEIYILPKRPGQNRVRWYDFDFKEVLLPHLPGAGVRLYYYDSATRAAEIAGAIIRDQYIRLSSAFEYVPERVVPYILYATHFEFQATNAFPISEGVLGVTSPADLTLSLPFFGDLEQYRHTSAHELAHEFTVQLIRTSAEAQESGGGMGGLPLWFIEGLAEYAAYGGLDPEAEAGSPPRGAAGPALPGLDPEAEAWARDLLYASDPYMGYLIPSFFSDFPMGYVHTYKLGQVRVAFLGSVFGRDTILWILRNAATSTSDPNAPNGQAPMGFARLLESATSLSAEEIDQLFHDWLKRRYLPAYDQASSRLPSLSLVSGLPYEPEAVVGSPDGETLLVRGVDRELGRGSLFLVDARDPSRHLVVAQDARPGLESLHLITRRSFAIGNGSIAWIGRSGAGDILHVARLEKLPKGAKQAFRISDQRAIELQRVGIIEAGDPAFSPDGESIAFTAVDTSGFKDVFILPAFGRLSEIKQITHDAFSESGLHWDERGIYLVSDKAPIGDTNIYLLDLESGETELLLADRSLKESPTPTAEGLLFASDRGGRWDLHRLEGDTAYRITDVPTQIRSPALGAEGSIYGILVHGGRFRMVRVPPAMIRNLDPRPPIDPAYDAGPRPLPRLALPEDAPDYRPFQHFGLDVGAVSVGTQSVAVGGLAFADLLRDKTLALQFAMYGSWDFTDAHALYLDRTHRLGWLTGVFHTFQPKRDQTFSSPAAPNQPDFYLEREFGVLGGVTYPFDRFQRMDLLLTLEGVNRDRFTDRSGTRQAEWDRRTGGSEPQALLSLGYGFDSTRIHPRVGPVGGSSALITLGGGFLPERASEGEGFNTWSELDLQQHIYLGGRSTIWLRLAGGLAHDGRFARQFYVSSVDNLRGFHFADLRLIGRYYYISNLELSVPLDWLIRIALFEGLRGVAGADFGGVANQTDELWSNRAFDLLAGVDFLAGPLALRLLFGFPIQIGPLLPSDGWVTNLALRFRY